MSSLPLTCAHALLQRQASSFLTIPALTGFNSTYSDHGVIPLFKPRMQNTCWGHRVCYFRHAVPVDAALVTPAPQGSIPHTCYLSPNGPKSLPVTWDSVVNTTVVGKPEEVEGLWLAPPIKALTVSPRKPPKTYQAGLVRVEFQRELLESVAQIRVEALCIALVLETYYEVVSPANDNHVATCLALPPLIRPQIRDIVKADIR